MNNVAAKQRHETLNKLLAQADDASTPTNDQKQHIKVAFAEGYLAANTEDKLGIAAKFVKVTPTTTELYNRRFNLNFHLNP